MKSRSTLMIGLLFLACLGVTVSSHAQFVQFTPVKELENERLDARLSQAVTSQQPDESLRRQGYVTIGDINVVQYLGKPCYGAKCAPVVCPSSTGDTNITQKLLEQAASHGGTWSFCDRTTWLNATIR